MQAENCDIVPPTGSWCRDGQRFNIHRPEFKGWAGTVRLNLNPKQHSAIFANRVLADPRSAELAKESDGVKFEPATESQTPELTAIRASAQCGENGQW